MAPRKKSKGKKPAETMRQRQMRLRKEQQAAKSRLARRTSSEATNQRVEKVKVKVEGQKKLPPSKTTKALPPGKKGGPVSTGNRPRRRNVNTNPPSNTTRTGSQSPASVRREQAAVKRAQAEIGRKRMGPLSSVVAAVAESILNPVARGAGYQGGKAIRKALGGGEPKLDSKGNPIKPKPKKKPNNAAAINARLKAQREARERAASRSGSNNNSQILRPKPASKDKPTPTPTKPTYTPPSKPKPRAASATDAQDLRSGRTPPKPNNTSPKPKPKKYGVKDGNNKKGRTKRLMSALKDLKVRKYKK